MDAATAKLDLSKIIDLFERHRVEYLVIGGQAAILHGSPEFTRDTDLCYRRTSQNLGRLANALKEIRNRSPSGRETGAAEGLAGC